MSSSIDYNCQYQYIIFQWVFEDVYMSIHSAYMQVEAYVDKYGKDHPQPKWYDAARIKQQLSVARKFTSQTTKTVFYVDAPQSMSNELIARCLKALETGKTKKLGLN